MFLGEPGIGCSLKTELYRLHTRNLSFCYSSSKVKYEDNNSDPRTVMGHLSWELEVHDFVN